MKLSLILFFIALTIISTYGSVIKLIYFDTTTTVTASKQDGVVVLELFNGTISTICLNSGYDTNNAKVICKMMNYTGGNPSGSYNIISSKTSSIGSTLYQNIACTGSETTLEDCPNFYISANVVTCSNHNQDVHVYCSGSYSFNNVVMNISSCIGSLSNGSPGLLTATSNSVTAYFCGVNGNFGPNEAAYICKYTLCMNTSYSRIVEGYNTSIRVIGGFNNMSCSASGCVNMYPFQSNGCSPNNNIGVLCTNDTTRIYPQPNITCSSTSVSVSWDTNSFSGTLANNYFAIQFPNGTNCTGFTADSVVTTTVTLSANYSTCGMMTLGDNMTITFMFRMARMFPKINNVVTTLDQYFNVSCNIARNDSVKQGPLQVNPVALPPSSSNTSIPSSLTLFSDSAFNNPIPNMNSVSPGSVVFVLVSLINPTPNVILVLSQCFYGSPNVNLILNRCPQSSTVQINPINATTKSFNFVVTQSAVYSTVTCITSKCSTTDTGCPSSC